MVPAPSCPYTWDYWTASPSDCVDLTCLLPNSIYIPLRVSWDATLHDVKEVSVLVMGSVTHIMLTHRFLFLETRSDCECLQ